MRQRKIRRGDIFFVSLDPTLGHEQKGHRPVLVVSTDRFNELTQTQIVVPISNGAEFARKFGFGVHLQGFGLKTTGVVRCDQPRLIDLEAIDATFFEHAPDPLVNDVLDRLEALFEH